MKENDTNNSSNTSYTTNRSMAVGRGCSSIPNLLYQRSLFLGTTIATATTATINNHQHQHRHTRWGGGRVYTKTSNDLAVAVAWNPSRMRNMRLAVGPTTPASTLWSQSRGQQEVDEDDDSFEQQDETEVEATLMAQLSSEEDEGGNVSDDNVSEHSINLVGEEEKDDSSMDEEDSMDGLDDSIAADVRAALRGIHRRREQDTDPSVSYSSSQSSLLPSLRHGGCINTACWLADNYNSNNDENDAPPTKIMTSGDDRLLKIWNVKDAMDLAWENGWDSFAPFATNAIRDHVLPSRPNTKLPGTVELLHTYRTGHHGNVFHITPHHGKVLTTAADGSLRLVDEQRSTLILQSEGMAYSHLVLTEHTGLVCYDNGLNQFDLRCSLHSQPDPIITGILVKACALYRPTLLFVGSQDVKLIDIRGGVGGDEESWFYRSYEPSYYDCDPYTSGVSVSGLDISKDNQSLLVSYESDQIYEYPICPNARSRAGPTVEEIDQPTQTVHETTCFGGHLNRFTFLKNAKYAGPNDEYVVTGSDSGRAWIFRRDTRTVVSLLAADTNTCNGVIPHPSLPFFITYGIDSTAKLWRAAPSYKDDSRAGRYKAFLEAPYEMSPVTKSWVYVENQLKKMKDRPVMYPDFVSTTSESMACRQFHTGQSFAQSFNAPKIGNALLHLPSLLRQNRYEVYRLSQAVQQPMTLKQPVTEFSRSVIRSRLQFQADRLGATVDAHCPWILRSENVHPADLIPDFPSDWILLDQRLTEWNLMDLDDRDSPWLSKEQQQTPKGDECFREKVITETAIVLKEAGNLAMSEKRISLAARRLDKAIQYCAVLGMPYLDNPLEKPRPWSPLVHTLVTSRLNLSLALLTDQQSDLALKQGQAALALLLAYEKTDETQKLRQKAHFRVGSAALACGDYEAAVMHLDLVGESDDPVLKRRRNEARQRKGLLLQRRRKKYRKFFDQNEGQP